MGPPILSALSRTQSSNFGFNSQGLLVKNRFTLLGTFWIYFRFTQNVANEKNIQRTLTSITKMTYDMCISMSALPSSNIFRFIHDKDSFDRGCLCDVTSGGHYEMTHLNSCWIPHHVNVKIPLPNALREIHRGKYYQHCNRKLFSLGSFWRNIFGWGGQVL